MARRRSNAPVACKLTALARKHNRYPTPSKSKLIDNLEYWWRLTVTKLYTEFELMKLSSEVRVQFIRYILELRQQWE